MNKTNQPSGCPAPPSLNQQTEDISRMLNSMGADSKCKSAFQNSVDTELKKGDAAMAVASLGGIGGGTASFTDSSNKIAESLTKEGCSDVFANISQQMSSQQAILCSINNTTTTTSLAGSAMASIKIIQPTPTPAQLKLRELALKNLTKPGPRPNWMPHMDDSTYKFAIDAWTRMGEIHKQELDSIMGKVTISNSTFKNKAETDMKSVSNLKAVKAEDIQTHFKNAANAQALNDLKNKSGLGSDSPELKSLVTSKIDSRNQEITSSVNNTLNSMELGTTSGNNFILKVNGPLNLENVTIDQYAHGRLMANNILKSAANLGSSVANEILQESATTNHSDKEASGQADLMKKILDGQHQLSKDNSAGVEKFWKTVGGIANMAMIGFLVVGLVILMFFPTITNIIAPGPLKYVLGAILMYLIFAWFFSFWPFSKSEKSVMAEMLGHDRITRSTEDIHHTVHGDSDRANSHWFNLPVRTRNFNAKKKSYTFPLVHTYT